MKYILSLATLLFCVSINAQKGIAVTEMTHCDNMVTALLTKYNIPGASFALSKNGKIVYMRSFGFSDKAKTIPTQPHHLFRIASLSKPITSIAIMKMMQDGLLNMSSKVFGPGGLLQDHPVIKTAAITDTRIYDITVQQLLEHSAGWNSAVNCNPSPTSPYPWYIGGCDPITFPLRVTQQLGTPNPVTEDDICKYMLQRGLNFIPGTQYRYSNVGYLYLGEIIEQLSGMTYEAYVQSAILAPLGIYDMHIGKNLLSEKQEREVEYTSTEGNTMSVYGTGVQLPWEYGGMNLNAMDAHGGWIASARALVTLITAVDNFATKPDLLTPASIATMVTPAATSAGYAKGWQVNASNNWWHSGAVPGTSTIMARTNGGYTWAVLLNRRNAVGSFWSEFDNLPWNCMTNTTAWPTHDLMLAPTQNASGITFSNATASAVTVNFTKGNGANRLLLVRPEGAAEDFPLDGSDYAANADYNSAPTIGTASRIIYNGDGSTVTVSNLTPGVAYQFRVIEYNKGIATGNNALYLLGQNPQALHTTGNPLPIMLTSFTAAKRNATAVLNWATASEENAAHFIVQRSVNNITFEDISKVIARGTSTVSTRYQYVDKNIDALQKPTIYYRLKLEDRDGRFVYSAVQLINSIDKGIYQLTPNPANGVIRVTGKDIKKIVVLTVNGNIVWSGSATQTTTDINLKHLALGMYVVKIYDQYGVPEIKRLILK